MIPVPLLHAARSRDLRGDDLRVFVELHAHLDWIEYRTLKLLLVAEALHVHEGQVSRALTALTAAGLIDRGPRVDRVYTYRLTASPPRKTPAQLLAGVIRGTEERPGIASKQPDRRQDDPLPSPPAP